MSSFKYISSCFSKDGGTQEDVRMKVVDEQKTFGLMKKMCNIRSVSLRVNRELFKAVVVPTVTHRISI